MHINIGFQLSSVLALRDSDASHGQKLSLLKDQRRSRYSAHHRRHVARELTKIFPRQFLDILLWSRGTWVKTD